MGKYLKKSRLASEVSSPASSSLLTMGVRTRAKTLALQRLRQGAPSPQEEAAGGIPDESEFSYLQLRSRRLHKLSFSKGRERKEEEEPEKGGCRGSEVAEECGNDLSASVEVSFGENDLEFDCRDRSTRESTPCSLIGGSNSSQMPGSTNRRRSSNSSQRIPNDMLRGVPTTQELEDFFAIAEQQQRKSFIEKYNFDILNDTPLPGRFEWVEVMP